MSEELSEQHIHIANEAMRAASNCNSVEVTLKDERAAITGIISITEDDHFDRFEIETNEGKTISVETKDVQEIRSDIPDGVWID